MDTVSELLTAFNISRENRSGENPQKLKIIATLKDSQDEKVLPFFLKILADEDEYDLARVDIAKILELRRSKTNREHERVTQTLIKVLETSEDELVKQYAAMAATNYIDASGMFEALVQTVLNVEEDRDVRYNAFAAVEHEGATSRTIEFMKRLLSDAEFRRTASRVLREWQISED